VYSSFDSFEASRIAGHIGAEISGIDLTAPLPDDSIAELRCALHDHKVIFVRDQPLTHADQVALGERFGPLTRRPGALHGAHPADYPQILTVDPQADDQRYGPDFEERYRRRWRTYESGWHSDLTPYVNPPAMSILRADRTPSFGGDTHWTNLAAAYAGLSGPLRTLVDGLRAEHGFFAGCHLAPADPEDAAVLAMNKESLVVAEHPIVRVHPETGETALFINPASTDRIVGLTPTESRALLDLLFAQITRSEYTVRWRWRPDDVAIWDNRATAHLAATDLASAGEPRTMYRVTVMGDRPVGPRGDVSEAIAGEPLAPFSAPIHAA
jgi:alpha-ketoglutarate-dependent taurine dioxygenase